MLRIAWENIQMILQFLSVYYACLYVYAYM
jgi:hypothetical protein